MFAVEAFLAIAVYLIEGFTNGHATFLQLDLYHGQAIDQNCNVIAVGMGAVLFKLLDHLQFVARHVLLIDQIDVLDAPVVKNEVINVVIVDLAGLIDNAVAGPVQICVIKSLPFIIRERDNVQRFHLHPHIGQHGVGRGQGW